MNHPVDQSFEKPEIYTMVKRSEGFHHYVPVENKNEIDPSTKAISGRKKSLGDTQEGLFPSSWHSSPSERQRQFFLNESKSPREIYSTSMQQASSREKIMGRNETRSRIPSSAPEILHFRPLKASSLEQSDVLSASAPSRTFLRGGSSKNIIQKGASFRKFQQDFPTDMYNFNLEKFEGLEEIESIQSPVMGDLPPQSRNFPPGARTSISARGKNQSKDLGSASRDDIPGRLNLKQRASSAKSEELNHGRQLLRGDFSSAQSKYQLGAHLGEGASGVVRMCTRQSSGDIFACKSVSKDRLKCELDMEDLLSELETMAAMQRHPYCVKLEDFYEDKENIHVIMEMCTGGDLFSRVKKQNCFGERDAAIVCYKLASALDCAHQRGIMHRDLKPENILMASSDSNTDIRLADFGSATFFKPGQQLNQLIGSPLYIAPSVLRHSYGPEADLWSLGVVLYILLSGVPPFWGPNNADIFKKVMYAEVHMKGSRWRNVSHLAKDLVSRLLTRNDKRRLTARQVQDHPWILQHCENPSDPESRKLFPRLDGTAENQQDDMTITRMVKSSEGHIRRGCSLEPRFGHEVEPCNQRRSVLDLSPSPFRRLQSVSSVEEDQTESLDEGSTRGFFFDEDYDIPIATPVNLPPPSGGRRKSRFAEALEGAQNGRLG